MTDQPADAEQPTLDPQTFEKFHRAICILEQFDCVEMRGIVKGTLAPDDREKCITAMYYRAALNVSSLVTLNDPRHFQTISQAARTLFELSVDVRLVDVVPDAPAKIFAFSDVERLKGAKDVVDLANAPEPPRDLEICAAFIASNEASILATKGQLWPGAGRLDHWSGRNLVDRLQLLPNAYAELHKLNYRRLSWYAHPGLTGVLNLEAAAFTAVAGTSLQIAAESYGDILSAMISLLQLDKAVDQIRATMKFTRLLAFTESPEEAEALRAELLG
jgi:hypothetical protein